MLVVRPAGPDDLDDLEALAVLSGRGFTSLPEDRPTLAERLAVSARSFAAELAPVRAWYTLMLEDAATGRVEGVAGVKAAVGLERPFFSFRVTTLAQSSTATGVRFDHQVLVLVNECAGWTEVGSLYLRPERRGGGGGALLSGSRYLLLATEPALFAETVLAELRGWFDPDGACPFWEQVGCRFFRLPFDQADLMSASTDGQFILDLAPRHPIYVELLPAHVRECIGRVNAEGEPARVLLEREGFRRQSLVDIFDAGPTMACRRDDIATVRDSWEARASAASPSAGARNALVSTCALQGFRAVRTSVELDGGEARLGTQALDALRIGEGARVRIRL